MGILYATGYRNIPKDTYLVEIAYAVVFWYALFCAQIFAMKYFWSKIDESGVPIARLWVCLCNAFTSNILKSSAIHEHSLSLILILCNDFICIFGSYLSLYFHKN